MTIIDTPPVGADQRSPFSVRRGTKAAANIHGANSLETFSSASSLSRTHEDADGFYAYLNRFNPANFRFKDAGVKYWEYTEPYDDWQGLYGADAVGVFYHSGHGTMDANGVFYAPLGAPWSNKDWVNSTEMQLGNERLRYIFWSTCLSLRVLDGQSPIRTWHNANQGLRMIFGWETVSWDSDVYGRRMWDHWNAGDSFSRAWMNAGWDAGHDQAPSACGMGASQAEAQNRVFNERMFSFGAASKAWYWWTWYNAARSVSPKDATLQAAPADAYVLQLGAVPDLERSLAAVGSTNVVHPGLARVELGSELDADRSASRPLSATKALAAAQRVVDALDLGELELRPHLVREQRAAGATSDGSQTTAEQVAGYAVEYRQMFEGVPVISPESGYLRVHLDAAGKPLSADVTARPVVGAKAQPIIAPPEADGTRGSAASLDDLLTAGAATHPALELAAEALPETREVGYVTEGGSAKLAVQQGYLADFGDGLQKKIRITVGLNG